MAEMELSSQQDFEAAIEQGVALVDFNAPWCGPCRAQDPIIHALQAEIDGRVKIGKVNIDENRDVALQLGIQSIPTIIIFKDGREMNRLIGLQSAESLKRAVESVVDN